MSVTDPAAAGADDPADLLVPEPDEVGEALATDPVDDEEAFTHKLLASMSQARWFAGKGRLAELTGLEQLEWLSGPALTGASGQDGQWPAVRIEIAEVSYADSSGRAGVTPHELYQLALSYYAEPQPDLAHAEVGSTTEPALGRCVAYDAAQDPAAGRVLMRRLLAAGEPNADASNTGARPADGAGSGESTDDDAPEVGLTFRLVPGSPLSADLEPAMFGGQQSNTSVMFGDVAMMKLFRRLEIGHNLDIQVHDALAAAGVADVAALYGWIEARWMHRGTEVRADLAMVVEKLRDARDGWELALDTLREGGSFAEEAAALGTALAEIHDGLRSAFGSSRTSGSVTAAIMQQRLQSAATVAPALLPYRKALNGTFGALGALSFPTQRVHGDFHLGQTLRVPGGWKIIDFEGEPVKTLAERRAPDSIWRDIAGMLRSFDYAGASVPGPRSAGWVAECRSAFLQAYAGGELDRDDAETLRAYEADKAVYEVVYEVRNRPDWVAIPLGAIAGLTNTTPANGATNPSADDAAVKE